MSLVLDGSNGVTTNAGVLTAAVYTVAGLPAGTTGMKAFVSNALSPAFGSAAVGGGSVTIPVFYNGTTWIVG